MLAYQAQTLKKLKNPLIIGFIIVYGYKGRDALAYKEMSNLKKARKHSMAL